MLVLVIPVLVLVLVLVLLLVLLPVLLASRAAPRTLLVLLLLLVLVPHVRRRRAQQQTTLCWLSFPAKTVLGEPICVSPLSLPPRFKLPAGQEAHWHARQGMAFLGAPQKAIIQKTRIWPSGFACGPGPPLSSLLGRPRASG